MTLYFVLWYIIGLAGCILAAYTDLKRGGDVRVVDIILIIISSVAGLIILLIAIAYFYKYNKKYNPFNYVVIKGHKS